MKDHLTSLGNVVSTSISQPLLDFYARIYLLKFFKAIGFLGYSRDISQGNVFDSDISNANSEAVFRDKIYSEFSQSNNFLIYAVFSKLEIETLESNTLSRLTSREPILKIETCLPGPAVEP